MPFAKPLLHVVVRVTTLGSWAHLPALWLCAWWELAFSTAVWNMCFLLGLCRHLSAILAWHESGVFNFALMTDPFFHPMELEIDFSLWALLAALLTSAWWEPAFITAVGNLSRL